MNIVGTMSFYGQVLNIYNDLNKPLFLAGDVATVIDYGIKNVSHMLETIDEREKKLVNVSTRTNTTNGGHNTNKWFITEDGLYELLMQSRKPIAKRFKLAVKQILKDYRTSHNQNIEEFFEDIDLMAELKSLNDLREDMNLPELSMAEYMINRNMS